MENKQQRVAIYARVSSQEQATEGVSLDAQLALLRAHAEARGWEVFDEYVDGGYSGGTDDRPAFKRMLYDVRQKRFDIIAVCKLDRFFRNLRLLLNCLYELEQLDITFMSVQEGLDTSSPFGKFAVQIMGVIAEFERGRIGERVKDSRHHILARGDWPGGGTLYGYRWHNKDRKWEIVPEEADIVKRVYALYVGEKLGMIPITQRLNDDGYLTRKGFHWRVTSVRQVLTHPAYKGKHPVGIQVPPIVDEAMWQKAQDKRETARSILAAPKGWLLQGMVFCGLCGHALKCLRKNATQPAYYACRGRVEKKKYKGTDEACRLPYVRADKLEWSVWSRVKAVLNEPDKLLESVNQALLDLEERKSRVAGEILDVDKKLEAVQGKAERLGIAFADGVISKAVYRSKLKQFKQQTKKLLKYRDGFSPKELSDLAVLEEKITLIKEITGKGNIRITEFGIFGSYGDLYVPVGFNAWRETDGGMSIGDVTEMDSFGIEGTDLSIKGNDAPPGFWECENPDEREERIKRNMRAILQFFNIKVFVLHDRVEIRGTIPPQVLTRGNPENANSTAPIIKPASPMGKGEEKKRGASPLLDTSISIPKWLPGLPRW